jgi:CHAD domain-containing protein
MQPDLDPLKLLLETKRARALTQTRRALKAQRTRDALAEWGEFTHATYASKQSVKALASHRITSVYKQMVKMGTAIDDDSPAEDLHELRKVGKELRYLLEFFASLYPPEALHDLRKRGKELRYLLEFFAGLYPAKVVRPMVKTLKALQDSLGRFQDHEVQANKLRELAPEVDDPMTLMAMGVLVDRFIKDEALARLEFADRFAAFASPEQREIVKEHFARCAASWRPTTSRAASGRRPRRSTSPRSRPTRVTPRCCGTSTRRARARSCSACARRSRAAATSSCAASRTSTR